MAVHELTTNAIKFGALSVPEGKVEVDWTGGEMLALTWVERNGPPVTRPERRGFGMTLIERVFAHDAGGQANIDFRPEGVVATLRAPLPEKQPPEKQSKETP
jgi:two-component sensor histidine kinase